MHCQKNLNFCFGFFDFEDALLEALDYESTQIYYLKFFFYALLKILL